MSTVVVLTKYNAYWGETSLRDALLKWVKGKIEIVAADESRLIHAGIGRDGAVFKMPAPLVVRLMDFVGYHVKRETIGFSKEAVWERDRNVCQFYHRDEKTMRKFRYKCTTEDRSIDHLIPKVRGGKGTFYNCVTACKFCNNILKGNRTPAEAGLEIIRLPEIPRRRKGDMVIVSFTFNPNSDAHRALAKMGYEFA